MSVSRKMSPERTKERQKVQQLIKELMRVWASKNVQQNYQNYYLTYLDSLPDHLIEIEISREIKKTLENKSHFFNINKSLALHSTSIAKLKHAIDKLQTQDKVSESDLEYVCELLDELRSNNMLVAENTLNFNYQSSSKSNSQFGFVHGNNYIFEKINTDHEFIKSSFLRKYIVFTHSYDPFFLYHYETAKTTNDPKYKSHPSIENLFNLSISKAYKIMKLQQDILEFLSGKIPAERSKPRKKPKRYNYSIVNDQRLYDTTIVQAEDQNKATNRLQNDPYVKKGRSRFRKRDEAEQPYLGKRTVSQSNSISQYFNSGIGRQKEIERNRLPVIQRRTSFNGSNLKQSSIYNVRNRRINSIGNDQEAVLPVTLNNSNLKASGINMIRKRQKDFVNQLPTKYAKPPSVNHEMLHIQEEEIKQMRGASIEIDQPQLSNQATLNNSPYHNQMLHYKGPPLIDPVNVLKAPPDTLKNFKLKAGNLTLHSFFIFLRQLSLQQKYRKTFQVRNWQHSIRNNQYYLHKFYINEVLMAISICCALPEGDFVIKYWGPTTECDSEMSQFLFRKYLDHVERQSICKCIFYNADPITEMLNSGFMPYKDRIFRRERSLAFQVESFGYYPFLSIDFSSIAIPKSTNKNIQDDLIIPSNVYSAFSEKQFFCFNYLLIINKLINPGQLSSIGSYSPNLGSMKEVQTQMIKRQLFFNPYNLQSAVNPINLATLKMRNPVFSACFVAKKPYIKVTGRQIYSDKDCLIVDLQLLKNNTILYFGKGFRSIGQMISAIKSSPGSYKPVEYCLRMFSKRMRGKIHSINLRDEVCFGDLEVVFEWRDFLKGRIQHNFEQFQMFGQNQSFYCLLEIDQENIFAFEVNDTNFI